MSWHYDAGVWRWRSPDGAYYRVEHKGGTWHAGISRPHEFPMSLGKYSSANEGKAACVTHARGIT